VYKKGRLMKYKIIKSDILLNGKLIPENSEVELSEADTKGIEDFLMPCLPAVTSLKAGHSERAQRVEESPDSGEESQNSKTEPKTKRGNK
jgi:hypothetical protein